MKENSLKSKSSDKLQSELKTLKIITAVLSVVILLLFAITLVGLIMGRNNPTFISLMAVGFSCSAILPVQFMSMKKIKTELESRSQ